MHNVQTMANSLRVTWFLAAVMETKSFSDYQQSVCQMRFQHFT